MSCCDLAAAGQVVTARNPLPSSSPHLGHLALITQLLDALLSQKLPGTLSLFLSPYFLLLRSLLVSTGWEWDGEGKERVGKGLILLLLPLLLATATATAAATAAAAASARGRERRGCEEPAGAAERPGWRGELPGGAPPPSLV